MNPRSLLRSHATFGALSLRLCVAAQAQSTTLAIQGPRLWMWPTARRRVWPAGRALRRLEYSPQLQGRSYEAQGHSGSRGRGRVT